MRVRLVLVATPPLVLMLSVGMAIAQCGAPEKTEENAREFLQHIQQAKNRDQLAALYENFVASDRISRSQFLDKAEKVKNQFDLWPWVEVKPPKVITKPELKRDSAAWTFVAENKKGRVEQRVSFVCEQWKAAWKVSGFWFDPARF
jgi:hypothetical protein